MRDTIAELEADTRALQHLAELEEQAFVPPERGGPYFSDWEREFIRNVREQHNRTLEFTERQRAKIREIREALDSEDRGPPPEASANLFSRLSPARQAEQRARADKVKLPWEK